MASSNLHSIALAILLSFCTSVPSFAYLAYGGSSDQNLYIDQPVKLEEMGRLSKLRVSTVSYWEGADEKLFDSSKTFPHLRAVGLNFDGTDWLKGTYVPLPPLPPFTNPKWCTFTQLPHPELSTSSATKTLTALVDHYPNISILSIGRRKPITDVEMDIIGRFRNLTGLNISGTFAHPANFGTTVPKGLRSLGLLRSNIPYDSNTQVCLPRLQVLRLSHCKISADFLSKLFAPKIQRVIFEDCELSPNCFDELAKFDKLRELVFTRTDVTEEILKRWHRDVRLTRMDQALYARAGKTRV